MIDSKGNVRLEGMFNRVRLAPEAQLAYDTRGVVVGDVPNGYPRSVPNRRQKRSVPNCHIRSKITPQVEDGQRADRI